MSFRDTFNNWLLHANWLDTANKYAAPFEQGSRFGIGGGGQIGRGAGVGNNLLGALGVTAGALSFLPAAALRAIQGARTADEALQIARGAKATRLADEIIQGARGSKTEGTLVGAVKGVTRATANPLVRGTARVAANAVQNRGQKGQQPSNYDKTAITNPQGTGPFDMSLVDGGAGGSGGAGTENPGFSQFFNGQWYTDPAAYYDAVNQEVDRQYNESINRAQTDTATQRSQFLQQVADAIAGINTQAEQGRGNIGAYYSNLGDIYQSSQGTRTDMFNKDVNNQLGSVDTQKAQGLSSLDQALNDYLTQASTTRQGALNQNYNDANAIAQSLSQGGIGSYSVYNPQLGQTQVQDTGALLSHLKTLLNPQNSGRRYNVPVGTKAPIYSYLNG